MSEANKTAVNSASETTEKQSIRFSSTGDDIVVFRSIDGTLFNIHRRNLQSTTDGPFAEDFPATPGEKVELTEDAPTLEILFAFAYPGVHPPLVDLPFEKLAAVAEAAEKYRVAPAMSMCHVVIRLAALYKDHAVEVLQYADKHGYLDLLDLAAPYSLKADYDEACKHFSLPLLAAWTGYKLSWEKVFRKDCDDIRFDAAHGVLSKPCSNWPRVVFELEKRVTTKSIALTTDWDELFDLKVFCSPCTASYGAHTQCYHQALMWKERLQSEAATVPLLSKMISNGSV